MMPAKALGKRRARSWKERVSARIGAIDLKSALRSKLKHYQVHPASMSLVPACIAILLLVIAASPLTWTTGSLAVAMNMSPLVYNELTNSRLDYLNSSRLLLPPDDDRLAVHIVMIFDEDRLNFSVAAMRSISFYASQPVVYHLIAPQSMHADLSQLSYFLVNSPKIQTHDFELCKNLAGQIWYMATHIHISAMCKVFLADVLPHTSRILYIDSDTTTVSDVSLCSFHSVSFGAEQYLGMGVDMGESCQLEPDLCYPIGFQWRIPEGLECGTVPFRAKRVRDGNMPCRKAGELETYQYNGGVMLMDLDKMRKKNFTTKFILTSRQTWRSMGHVQARWGEQDMMNNFFRLNPEILHPLQCGCNYQFSAARRESKCGGEAVVIAHGWSRQMQDLASRDRFNMHFNFFRHAEHITANSTPPEVLRVSMRAPDWNGSRSKPEHVFDCPHQRHICTRDDMTAVPAISAAAPPTVYILTRTSGRPTFFKAMAGSVREQTYPSIVHLALTDDPASLEYMSDIAKPILVDSLYHKFFPEEVCEKCSSLSNSKTNCASAPGLDKSEQRQAFFDCYCNTSYPMNEYMNVLQERVGDGWIMYLDDDNLLLNEFAISELMGHVESPSEMIAFRSVLGRVTPHDNNFGKRVIMGDFDSSNFMFHTSRLEHARWPGERCGDFKVGSNLAKHLPIRWVNKAFIQTNPFRDALGGLGKRQESNRAGVTVVITSYMTTGWRPLWVKEIIETYLGVDMNGLVSKAILVWNNVEEPVPSAIPSPDDFPGRLVVLRPTANSLNNRWMDTLAHIDDEEGSVLNLDDDLYTTREGLICMLNWHAKEPNRMVAPFVRRIEDNATYVMDELTDASAYSVVLPRIMLVPVKYMRSYASQAYASFRKYVDEQDAHCDDIVMNVVSQQSSNVPPLRVLLPANTVVDFYSSCWSSNKEQTGGLGLQKGRTQRRSECVRDIMKMANLTSFKSSTDVATCIPRGNAFVKRHGDLSRHEFQAMTMADVPCGDSTND
jgi:lipopolysaccharide biosynthesis glycosyltransferase